MVNKKELAKAISEKSGNIMKKHPLTIYESKKVVDAITASITELLVQDGKIQMIDFGTFEKKTRASRGGFNPQVGERIQIPEKTVPTFKAGKGLKEAVKLKKEK